MEGLVDWVEENPSIGVVTHGGVVVMDGHGSLKILQKLFQGPLKALGTQEDHVADSKLYVYSLYRLLSNGPT